MVLIWAAFMLMLFVGEPFVLHRHFPKWVEYEPGRAFAWLYRTHVLLLMLSLVTVMAAASGAHRWRMF